MSLTTEDVLDATDALVTAFAATDTDAYFSSFSPSASFVFYPEPNRLDSRADYEKKWAAWLADGWRVVACESTDRLVQVFGDTAVMSHSVRTTTNLGGTESVTEERETIIFVREHGRILAVHEHLSSRPTS